MSKSAAPKSVSELGDLAAAAGRRRWVWIPVFLVIWAVSIAIAYTLPPVYESTATILVELQEIPPDVVSSSIGGYIETRLGALDQRIRSSSTLFEVIKKYDLYPELSGDVSLEAELLDRMRTDLVRESSVVNVLSASGKAGAATVSFSIYFDYVDPEIAQRVVNEISERYLKENTRSRVEQAESVAQFLATEGDRLAAELDSIDGRLALFKEQHVNELPEQAEANRRLMDGTSTELSRTEQRIQALIDRKRDLEASMQMQNTNRMTVGELLEIRQSELTQAESRYSALHPDVKRLRKEVAELKSQMGDPSKVFVMEEEGLRPHNSQMSRALQFNLDEVKMNLSTENMALAELKRKIAEYESRLVNAPAIEREYQQLAFERDNTFAALRSIRQKQQDAELALQLERQSKAEKFTVVQPATLPSEPIKPNRFAFVLLGLVLAIGASTGLITLLESTDSSIHGAQGVEQIMHVGPLASIPVIPG